MGHILKLADEYKVEGVHDFCSKMLRDFPKSEDNAVKVFFLSTQTLMAREDDRLEPVRSQCKTIVKDMDLVDIQGSGVLRKLNKDACESLLVERIKGLETHVTQVYPQFVGLAEYCLHLGLKCSLPGLVKCSEHFINPKVNTALPERIVSCSHCKKMIDRLVKLSLESEGHEHVYGGEHHFNSDLISIVKNFTTVMRSLQRKTSLGAAQNLLVAGTSTFEAKTHATSPVCDSKAFPETVESGSFGFPPPAATPGFQAFSSPSVGNEAYQSSEVQFGNVAPGPPTTHAGTSLLGFTTERAFGTGGSLFASTASTGTSGTGSGLFGTATSETGSLLVGSTASTKAVGIAGFGQQTLTSKANSCFAFGRLKTS
ncbi:uncharacterized protein LOC141884905 isoform X1 [Acropora palmata]|uniref:uncharacterized protein LOC141884905 isoform X1 n=1 Tax=Acropora palmata TaxID=6131 RepID=UPI003DA02A7E